METVKKLTVDEHIANEHDILSKNLQIIRADKGFTRQQFADYCNVGITTIERIERSKKPTSMSTLSRIAHACGLDTWALLMPHDRMFVFRKK